jgi:GNAT superfamily N-acetyltransferase
MAVDVRDATVDDAEGIALAHVSSWRTAYAGIMPDDVLAALDPVERTELLRSALARDDRQGTTLTALRDGAVVGFAHVGHYHPEHGGSEVDESAGEVYGIYVHPDHWGYGVGRALIEAAVARLAGGRPRPVRLWVLDANESARRFYERCGFVADGATGRFPVDRPGGGYLELPMLRYTRPVPG